mgnify:CR=1 FL=1
MKTYRIETLTNSKAFANFCDWYEAGSEEKAIAEYVEDCRKYGLDLNKLAFKIREASAEEMAIFA